MVLLIQVFKQAVSYCDSLGMVKSLTHSRKQDFTVRVTKDCISLNWSTRISSCWTCAGDILPP